MKIGIITDIHNNIVALEAILKYFQIEKINGIICCGDIIGIGPSPEDSVQKILNLPNLIACVAGNHERYLTEGLQIKPQMDAGEKAQHQWEHTQLSQKSREFLHNLPHEQQLKINEKTIHITHFPTDKTGKYAPITYANDLPHLPDLEKVFENINTDVVLFGHIHKKSHQKGSKIFINPGSVGCPGKDKTIARAGILTVCEDIEYSEIDIEYNVKKVIEKIDELNYPACEVVKKIFYGIS